jgi:hypothetical protein
LEAYVKVVNKAHQLGFKIVSYQILGLPNETLDSMIQTLAFNARLPVLLGASPFYQTPNSPIAAGLELTEADFIRARLTALAIETENFNREDIYTLFVTTRILNFLKGLPITEHASLAELLSHPRTDLRTRLGFEILQDFLKTGCLHAWSGSQGIPNHRFRAELFHQVLANIGCIVCQNGQSIELADMVSRLGKIVKLTSLSAKDKSVRHPPLAETWM